MREYKTTKHLQPFDKWYKYHKHLFNPNQIEHYDDLYDKVLILEDEEGDLELRLKTLNEYKEKLINGWRERGVLDL